MGTASLNDAVTNTNRLRIADERALRANLRKLVEDLYALPDARPASLLRVELERRAVHAIALRRSASARRERRGRDGRRTGRSALRCGS